MLDLQQETPSLESLVDVTQFRICRYWNKIGQILNGAAVALRKITNSVLVHEGAQRWQRQWVDGGPQVRNSATVGGKCGARFPAVMAHIPGCVGGATALVRLKVKSVKCYAEYLRGRDNPLNCVKNFCGDCRSSSEKYQRLPLSVMRPQGVALQ